MARKKKATVTLYGDGMGPNATEADFDDFAAFVQARIDDLTGMDVYVEQERWGVCGETRVEPYDKHLTCDEVAAIEGAVSDLWDEWCAGGESEGEAHERTRQECRP